MLAWYTCRQQRKRFRVTPKIKLERFKNLNMLLNLESLKKNSNMAYKF